MAPALASLGSRAVPLSATLLERFMHTFEAVFHPLWFATASVLVLVVYEWYPNGGDAVQLGKRLGTVLAVIALGRLPALGYVLLSPIGFQRALDEPPWQVDVISVVGVALTAGALWLLWRRFDWGRVVPGGAAVLLATLVPYVAVAPFWNVSGHVTFTTSLAVYLVAVDRRFAPAFLVPLVSVANRPFVDAHTWLQSVAGFVLGLAVAGGLVVFFLDTGMGRRVAADEGDGGGGGAGRGDRETSS
jgi:hypothetical protein